MDRKELLEKVEQSIKFDVNDIVLRTDHRFKKYRIIRIIWMSYDENQASVTYEVQHGVEKPITLDQYQLFAYSKEIEDQAKKFYEMIDKINNGFF